jgi:CBS domain-containing protein
MPEDKLSKIKVKDIMHLIVKEPTTISQDASLDQLLHKILENTTSRHVYVINENDKLIGSVRLNNTIKYLFPSISLLENTEAFEIGSFLGYSNAQKVSDIMNNLCSYALNDALITDIIRIMIREKINELPVVDKDFKVIGEINVLEIIQFYLENE